MFLDGVGMRTIGVVTGGRADYSIYLPLLRAVQSDPELNLELYVTGTHLAPGFGSTVRCIEADGFTISARIDSLDASNRPEGISRSIAKGVLGFAELFERQRPDILLVLGDRFEMLAAVVAALPFTIPVAHIAGGELSFGSLDDCIRHAITKMSHLHFATAEPYRQRLIQMGEEPWRVTTTGSPSLDNLKFMKYQSREKLEREFDLVLEPAPLIVTFHPETLEPEETVAHARELLAALGGVERPILITAPNADAGGEDIRCEMERFAHANPRTRLVENMGTQLFFSVLRVAACMVGNSSSGIAEAASFELPVVNLGNRQSGRIMGSHIIQSACERNAIGAAIVRALDPAFRRALKGLKNPYGDGEATPRIVQVLKTTELGRKLVMKRFHDLRTSQHQVGRG